MLLSTKEDLQKPEIPQNFKKVVKDNSKKKEQYMNQRVKSF